MTPLPIPTARDLPREFVCPTCSHSHPCPGLPWSKTTIAPESELGDHVWFICDGCGTLWRVRGWRPLRLERATREYRERVMAADPKTRARLLAGEERRRSWLVLQRFMRRT